MKKLILAILLCAALLAAQGSSPAERQLQSAINKEVVQGDLKGAIKLYQDIVSKYKDNHQVAAKALVRMGGCYERLGIADAEKTYRQVLSSYPDQAEAVSTANTRLAALSSSATERKAGTLVLRQVHVPQGTPSPDGRFIAFVDYDSKENAADLALYEVATGNKKPLTDLGLGQPKTAYPMVFEPAVWSADGSQLSFIRVNGSETVSKTEFCTIDWNGSNFKVLTINTPLQAGMIAGWSPDRKVLYGFQHIFATGNQSLGNGELSPRKEVIK